MTSKQLPKQSVITGASEMANFDNGIMDFVIAEATVKVLFPIDWKGNPDVCCDQCYYFRRSYKTCGLNGEVCSYPTKYVGAACPLHPVEYEENNNNTEGETE